jgi:hypothetical protein
MAAPSPARGGVGWAILAVALAVPGFLFYNWWSHLKAEQAKAVAAKAHSRLEGGVFQTPAAGGRLVNPMSASSGTVANGGVAPAAAATTPATAQAAGMAPKPTPTPNPAAPVATTATPAAAASSTAAPPVPAAASSASAQSASAVSTTTITLSRDPMMSPMDLVRIRENEVRQAEEAERIRREAEEAKRPHPQKARAVKKEKPIQTYIELQGIVATPDGATLAIVNGATVNEGESFTVEGHSGKVKVLRISSSDVTFEYKEKRFKMSVSAE